MDTANWWPIGYCMWFTFQNKLWLPKKIIAKLRGVYRKSRSYLDMYRGFGNLDDWNLRDIWSRVPDEESCHFLILFRFFEKSVAVCIHLEPSPSEEDTSSDKRGEEQPPPYTDALGFARASSSADLPNYEEIQVAAEFADDACLDPGVMVQEEYALRY